MVGIVKSDGAEAVESAELRLQIAGSSLSDSGVVSWYGPLASLIASMTWIAHTCRHLMYTSFPPISMQNHVYKLPSDLYAKLNSSNYIKVD